MSHQPSQNRTDINIASNGESRVIKLLLDRHLLDKKSVVFDCGANEGEWTAQMLRMTPGVTVHSFEPDPDVAERLHRRFADFPNVTTCREALSDSTGETSFHVYGANSLSSLFARDPAQSKALLNPRVISVHTETVDDYCAHTGISHLHFLKIDVEGAENSVLRGARRMLGNSRVDTIQFEYGGTFRDAGETLQHSFRMLRGFGYEIFRIHPDFLSYLPEWKQGLEDYNYSNFLAVHERIVSILAGKKPVMLDMKAFLHRYAVQPKGLIHVGAHEGQEIPMYREMGIKRILLVEANPRVHERLVSKIGGAADCTTVCCAASDRDGELELHLTNMDQSSSILPLARHKEIYPQIVDQGTVKVPSRTIDRIVRESGIPAEEFDFLCLDIQGAELMALRGATEILPLMQGVLTEVNLEELYKGAPGIEMLDALLIPLGFHRVATTCPYHQSWGDALYLRKPRDPAVVNPFAIPDRIATSNTPQDAAAAVHKLFALVVSLHGQGDDKKAMEVIGSSIKNDQQLAILLSILEPSMTQNPRAEVEGAFLKLLDERFPRRYPLAMIRGRVLEHLGDVHGAMNCYKTAAELRACP